MVNGWFILYLLAMILVILVLVKRQFDKDQLQSKMIMDDVQMSYTYEEMKEYLDWMFQLGIINAIEYNEKLQQCTPFCIAYSRKRRS